MGLDRFARMCTAEVMDPDLRRGDEVGTYEVNLKPMSEGWDDDFIMSGRAPK
jgi:hypothetical protein